MSRFKHSIVRVLAFGFVGLLALAVTASQPLPSVAAPKRHDLASGPIVYSELPTPSNGEWLRAAPLKLHAPITIVVTDGDVSLDGGALAITGKTITYQGGTLTLKGGTVQITNDHQPVSRGD